MGLVVLILLFFGVYALGPAILNITREDIWDSKHSHHTTK